MTSSQFVGTNVPSSATRNPAGVCIHEFATRIHVVDSSVPIETRTLEMNIVRSFTRPSP